MATQAARPTDRLFWLVVLLVGVIVLAVVLGLQLFPRLGAGDRVLDNARPAFTAERVAGDRAGINYVSTVVDLADPLVTAEGGAAAEVPKLVTFLSAQTGLAPDAVVGILQTNFPKTTNLLTALPLSDVNAEIQGTSGKPGLVEVVATTLKLPPDQVRTAIAQNFPRLNQSIQALPTVVNGWNNVPGIDGLTRFNGTPVKTAPQLRDYFRDDVIPAVENQRNDFQRLDTTWPPINFIPPLLTFLGIAVVIFGLVMVMMSLKANRPPGESVITWSIVAVLGLVVILLVLGLQLYPRLGAGDRVLNGLRPAFAAERVTGDRAGINFVSTAVDLLDPIMLPEGGAAAEVPKLVTFLSTQTGLPANDIVGVLKTNFPKTTNLLLALPLSDVNAEIQGTNGKPGLVDFVATTLKLPPATVTTAIAQTFPRLNQSIQALPTVVNGWNNVPGIDGLTRFDGTPVKTAPQLREYFRDDVIPVMESQQANFQKLDTTWPPVTFFPPLLTIVGIIVLVYALLMVFLARSRAAAVQ